MIRMRVPHEAPGLRERIRQIPGVVLNGHDGPNLELECRDVKTALMRRDRDLE